MMLISTSVQAAPPTRAYTYVANTMIDPNQNNTNENALYSYLQTGVDTYAANSITAASISPSASIPYSSLSLAGSIVNADISVSAGIVGSKLNLTAPGIIGSVTPSTGQFTNLTITGTLNAGVTHQGDVFYDNGTSVVRLIPGTSGQVLKTQGAAANPVWAETFNGYDYGTSQSVSTTKQGIAMKIAYGGSVSVSAGSSTSITNLPFASSSSYKCTVSENESATTDEARGSLGFTYASGSAAAMYNTDNSTRVGAWICVGT